MRFSVMLVVLLSMSAGPIWILRDGTRGGHGEQSGETAPSEAETLIVPGRSVGLLHLGDPESKFHNLFSDGPNQGFRPIYNPDCGARLNWFDTNPNHPLALGVNVLIHEGVVTQIEAGTPRFHTKDGITWDSSPTDVKKHYPGLKAYEAIGTTSEAVGGRNLIFWVNMEKGLGFVFAYSRRTGDWAVYKIVVFPPNGRFCPEANIPTPDTWRELAPYSLDIPDRLALLNPAPSWTHPQQFDSVAVEDKT